jgi:hypothetical protein
MANDVFHGSNSSLSPEVTWASKGWGKKSKGKKGRIKRMTTIRLFNGKNI